MKRLITAIMVAAIAVFLMAMLAMSQESTIPSTTDSTDIGMQGNFIDSMRDMDDQNQMMAQKFDSLNQDFNRVEGMNDMGMIRESLRSQQEKMSDIRSDLATQEHEWDHMRNMMESSGITDGTGQDGVHSDFVAMMDSMENRHALISSQLGALEQNLDYMMNITNMSELREAMTKQGQLMGSVNQDIAMQMQDWNRMMFMMGADHDNMMDHDRMMEDRRMMEPDGDEDMNNAPGDTINENSHGGY